MSVRKPAWWLLYLLIPLLIGLSILDQGLVLSLLGHEIVQFGILVVFFGLVVLWVRSNSAALVRKPTPNPLALIITVYDPAARERPRLAEPEPDLKKAA